ncbi:MAG TPA: protocatechuate 3,4-dioxygenase subunit alpha [Candidatus Angelobacter sp.]|nr:protocatechuate 3,4-dioxygenase subunit alpha [Candidatus Angelobacter sp.]
MDRELTPTSSQTVGPFFHLGCTEQASVGSLVTAVTKGERIRLVCRVFDGEGQPVPDAMVEIWQANAEGRYAHPEDTQQKPLDSNFNGFGRLATDELGSCVFETIIPGRVPGNDGTLQAPHINVSVFARGVLKRLATRIYFADDPANAGDPILALVPAERRSTLLAQRDAAEKSHWLFNIHLCGENETVFFDV